MGVCNLIIKLVASIFNGCIAYIYVIFFFFYSVCVCLVFLWLCSRIAQCLRSIKLMFCCKIGTRCIVITKCIHRGRGIWILTSLWETLWNATHKQVAFSYFSFVPLSSHLLLSIHQNNSEDYFWVFILLVRMGMIKDMGFIYLFIFLTISYGSCPFPPNSILTKWVFDLCRFGAISTWRPTERYWPSFLICAIVSSFSSIFHDVVFFFSTCCFLFFVLRIPLYIYALRELKMLIFLSTWLHMLAIL